MGVIDRWGACKTTRCGTPVQVAEEGGGGCRGTNGCCEGLRDPQAPVRGNDDRNAGLVNSASAGPTSRGSAPVKTTRLSFITECAAPAGQLRGNSALGAAACRRGVPKFQAVPPPHRAPVVRARAATRQAATRCGFCSCSSCSPQGAALPLPPLPPASSDSTPAAERLAAATTAAAVVAPPPMPPTLPSR
jgi:hypothetical protein